MASPYPHGRTAALSLQLSQAHNELRRRLVNLRAGLGRRTLPDDSLGAHCLAFCSVLTNHHQGEDQGLFTALVRERPDLAPTVAKLVEDHGFITHILARVRDLAEQAVRAADGPGAGAGAQPGVQPGAQPGARRAADLEAIGRELDGLAAIMESHFAYEERAIGAALDAGVAGRENWSEAVLRFRAP
ncbi:hemerythrin domain-containing protein [Kitasatospora sp. NPDC028055]|uniref:hemerythrin domain-containing protein n=1 Tax=Kitasatospora sp. NPDC028055 TaxID=3155653 RepID=UPI0033F9F503